MNPIDFIHVECGMGHRLKAPVHLSGRTVKCPKCQSAVVIPQPASDRLSDTGLMRILGDADPLPAPAVLSKSWAEQPRVCPRCALEVSRQRSVCPHCSCFIGSDDSNPGRRRSA